MPTTFKSRFLNIAKWFAALFVLLFVFRFIYGFVAPGASINGDYSSDFFRSIDNVRKNYASENFSSKNNNVVVQSPAAFATNQKFEKTASIKTKSSEFEKDEKSVKKQVKSFNAIIQYEQNLGQKGNRQIHLLIGVNPALFDSFYLAIQKIGVIKATEITKVDKTNEYKQLNAKKASLEKSLQSLTELKSRAGQIADFITLHDKILEVEEKMQELGIQLGNFDAENEFCTVKLSLYEGATEKNISIYQRVKVALEWTIKFFILLVVSIFGVTVIIFLLLVVIEKLNLLKKITSKLDQ